MLKLFNLLIINNLIIFIIEIVLTRVNPEFGKIIELDLLLCF
jgi:hypothetical protein